jgi:SAM-dependent methyltransferase
MIAAPSVKRGRFQGVRQIIAFNWQWYVVGAGATLVLIIALLASERLASWRAVAVAGLVLAVIWSVASLAASHWIYDRSCLREWRWVPDALAREPRRWCNLHCGLDESSSQLRQLFPNAESTVLDIFDPVQMTEKSLHRARVREGCGGAGLSEFRNLPLECGVMDAIFLMFAAHELRRPCARRELFAEVSRVLGADGEAIVAEHLRDLPNSAAFGPGAFHFFSAREWRRVFSEAGLQVRHEFNITPFVRVFILRRKV